jgi:hypothetical protein
MKGLAIFQVYLKNEQNDLYFEFKGVVENWDIANTVITHMIPKNNSDDTVYVWNGEKKDYPVQFVNSKSFYVERVFSITKAAEYCDLPHTRRRDAQTSQAVAIFEVNRSTNDNYLYFEYKGIANDVGIADTIINFLSAKNTPIVWKHARRLFPEKMISKSHIYCIEAVELVTNVFEYNTDVSDFPENYGFF